MKCTYCGQPIAEISRRWSNQIYLSCSCCGAPISHTLQRKEEREKQMMQAYNDISINMNVEYSTLEDAYWSIEDELERTAIYGRRH